MLLKILIYFSMFFAPISSRNGRIGRDIHVIFQKGTEPAAAKNDPEQSGNQCKFIPGPSNNHRILDIILRFFTDANSNPFAINLFKLARKEQSNPLVEYKNVIFSPASIAFALSMLFPGAKGQTADEIKNQIAESFDDDLVIGFHARLQEKLRTASQGFLLNIVNKGFVEQKFGLKEDFQNTVSTCFHAPFQHVDFISKPEESRQMINEWVEEKTKEKIKDLFPEGSITTDTRLVLANAIYFNADWEVPFIDRSETVKKRFTSLEGLSDGMMTFMHTIRKFFFYKEEGVSVLGVPYKGSVATMYFILPENYLRFEAELNPLMLNSLMDSAAANVEEIIAYVPKFEMDYDFPLKDVLKNMGVKTMFDKISADLSGISDVKPLFVSSAVHKAFIAINENGTEAAAATGIGVSTTSLKRMFKPDKPFVYLIRHEESKLILFFGSVVSLP